MGKNARWRRLDWKLFEKNEGELRFWDLGKDYKLWQAIVGEGATNGAKC